MPQKSPNSRTVETHTPYTVHQSRYTNVAELSELKEAPRSGQETGAAMANIKISGVPVNPQTDAAMLAGAKFCPAPVPARETLAVLEPSCLVPLLTRDPRLVGCIPA